MSYTQHIIRQIMLNKAQQQAVEITNHPLLVLAGAGSGKTKVITEKISYLIKTGLPAKNIAAITFTNKAAREMRERVNKIIDTKTSKGLRVSTFHSLGLEILRMECKHLGYKSNITLFDDQDKKTLIKSLMEHSKDNLSVDDFELYASKIGTWKNNFVTPSVAISEDAAAGVIYEDYVRNLKSYNAVDFDDLILLPVFLFKDHPAILEKWQNKIRYLLVDEYQDTNITQYELIRLLAGKLGKFTVVGDDDQSIYAWRGASPENLNQLQIDYPTLQVVKLEQNYRSTSRILKVANRLIGNNPHVYEKKLWSQLGEGEPLRVLSHKNEVLEAESVVMEIMSSRFRAGGCYSDYAILYRGNHQSRLFEKLLRENSVPYFISASGSFFSLTEVKDILCYFRLFANHDDDAAFLRVVNTPRREIGPSTLEKLGAYANERHVSLFAACHEFGLQQVLSHNAIERLTKFCDWVSDTAFRIENKEETYGAFIDTIGYGYWLKENSKSPESAERKLKNVYELIDWLGRMKEETLSEMVAKIMLLDILERNQEEEAGQQVSLMTLHAAKGLEFKHVYLIGFEENIIPHQNSIEADSIEEERRLAYVGITRAKKTCTLSYCTHRKRYGDISECEPSRFLKELPEEDLEWKKIAKPVTAESKKQNISMLRSMLME